MNFIGSDPNADKGREGVKKSENFADIISGSSLIRLTYDCRKARTNRIVY